MKLFEEMPYLENDNIIIHEMTDADADALYRLSHNENVYKYLPTFLYEQKYDDAHESIAKMRSECFDTGSSIMMGVYLKSEPDQMVGIAEIYSYKPERNKASIGVRLDEPYWHKGIAAQVIALLKQYLDDVIKIRNITAHIMQENIPSARSVEKNGFEKKYVGLSEDWGPGKIVVVDKYIYKNPSHPKPR